MRAALFLTYSAIVPLTFAASACAGQQYNDLPGFPAYNRGCYPLNYYQTSDLGQTSPDDARYRCQQQCTSDARCSSVVAQVNKAADSNLYSGTCFYFASGNAPTSPRRCVDTAYLLQGYQKDATLSCFASSKPAASRFCSSYLSIPMSTVSTTTTSSLPVSTVTTTVTVVPTVSTTITSITTPSTTVSLTTTIVSTVGTSTATMSIPTTTTITVTTSTTSVITITSTTAPVQYTGRKRAATTVPAPVCASSDVPATRLSAACSCLSVSTGTTTTIITHTLPQSTTTVTTTTTAVPVTISSVVSVTAATATLLVTATSISSVTAFVTITTTNMITATSVLTQTSLTTSTVTATCSNMMFFKGATHSCYYTEQCQYAISGPTNGPPTMETSIDACFARCDAISQYQNVQCRGLTYVYASGSCQLYSQINKYVYVGPAVDSYTWSYCRAPS